MDRQDLLTKIEHRLYAIDRLEVRAPAGASGGAIQLVGYASVFDHGYDMYGGPPFPGWTEFVKPGAFTRTLRNKADVQLLINHDGLPLARTTSKTLTLTQDDTGLNVEAKLEPTDPDVQRLVPKMKRRDLDEMSFAFRVIKDQWFNEDGEKRNAWDEDATVRHLLEVSIHKGDVSVVNYGANDATSTELLAFDRALVELRAGRPLEDLDDEARNALVTRLGLVPDALTTDDRAGSPATDVAADPAPVVDPDPPAPPAETLSLATALALAEADREPPAAA